ncbi:unnamed protein product [Rotaria magnacalcarata]|uniref:Uncharacterized protein n=5 Tax=Rotaria magnacalcarata TaxID=392030 RepID=A0A816YFC5_9BILA|nr:unnamed protein product [Rotaria magnacalcarata]CAF1615931.1 unnamed protein product [Rotaria magnacalcarata]CAF2110360.1 unnamed protein product [Rotaria magnacalcarata]CAF2112678.1 unnamed protein product [Rotaria magnacalcarata]CAF2156738.1 unnamed protein product [Rotaria magnacalcarata]
MKAITVAVLGACLLFVAHGVPISRINREKREYAVERTVSSSYSSGLTVASGFYIREDASSDEIFYYQAIQVTASISGTYNFISDSEIDTVGYFYENSFDPSVPGENLILTDDDGNGNRQFLIEAFLEAERVYVLVVTTFDSSETGTFSVSASGPGAVDLNSFTPSTSQPITTTTTVAPVLSALSGGLSSAAGVFHRPDSHDEDAFYYQAIEVSVQTSGMYTLTSDSKLDTIGYFYHDSFDPSVPENNLITVDDDSGDISLQFGLEVYLQAGNKYILVVTTHETQETGDFSVLTNGPGPIELTSFTPSTIQPVLASTTAAPILSALSGELSPAAGVFNRPDSYDEGTQYYQAIEVSVQTSGMYTLTSDSEIDTFGYFYHDSFDPSLPENNLITADDDSGDISLQFGLEVYLQAGNKYILVVTTHGMYETGDFSILTHGPDHVELNPFTPSTSQPLIAVTTPAVVSSAFSSELPFNNLKFARLDYDGEVTDNASYYYQAIEVVVSTSGMYTFNSHSDFDTMGYLYDTSFDSSKPTEKLIIEDDDSGDEIHQFGFKLFLEAEHTYILVVTTHLEEQTGSFSVSMTGPASAVLRSSAK